MDGGKRGDSRAGRERRGRRRRIHLPLLPPRLPIPLPVPVLMPQSPLATSLRVRRRVGCGALSETGSKTFVRSGSNLRAARHPPFSHPRPSSPSPPRKTSAPARRTHPRILVRPRPTPPPLPACDPLPLTLHPLASNTTPHSVHPSMSSGGGARHDLDDLARDGGLPLAVVLRGKVLCQGLGVV